MCSTFYWMIFDDGFVKMGDLLSKTMMGENSSVWQKGFGGQFIRSLMLTSFDKAAFPQAFIDLQNGAYRRNRNGLATISFSVCYLSLLR